MLAIIILYTSHFQGYNLGVIIGKNLIMLNNRYFLYRNLKFIFLTSVVLPSDVWCDPVVFPTEGPVWLLVLDHIYHGWFLATLSQWDSSFVFATFWSGWERAICRSLCSVQLNRKSRVRTIERNTVKERASSRWNWCHGKMFTCLCEMSGSLSFHFAGRPVEIVPI